MKTSESLRRAVKKYQKKNYCNINVGLKKKDGIVEQIDRYCIENGITKDDGTANRAGFVKIAINEKLERSKAHE